MGSNGEKRRGNSFCVHCVYDAKYFGHLILLIFMENGI